MVQIIKRYGFVVYPTNRRPVCTNHILYVSRYDPVDQPRRCKMVADMTSKRRRRVRGIEAGRRTAGIEQRHRGGGGGCIHNQQVTEGQYAQRPVGYYHQWALAAQHR